MSLAPPNEPPMKVGVRSEGGNVVIDFGKPTMWLVIDKPTAIKLAETILRKAKEV